jgi:hypothetical protein
LDAFTYLVDNLIHNNPRSCFAAKKVKDGSAKSSFSLFRESFRFDVLVDRPPDIPEIAPGDVLRYSYSKVSALYLDFLNIYFYVHYSTLLILPPLSFHCVGGCWDRT